jgi:NAD(P)-dependent dehydrogenase (short-subunit alcohol dehydrogenase family)
MNLAKDCKAVVTGGASGFGLATAIALADEGARVVIADVSADGLRQAVMQDSRLIPYELDTRDANAVRAMVDTCIDRLGGIDYLVYSAGVIRPSALDDVTEDDWDLTLDINLKGMFLTCQAIAPALRRSGSGRIVGISSMAGKRGSAANQAYCASKFGVVGLCESLALELASSRVTVNCVCPGACPTTGIGRMLTSLGDGASTRSAEEMAAAAAVRFPLGRYVLETDVVAAIMFFLSEEAGFITGVALDVDGGARLRTPSRSSVTRGI